MYRNIVCKQDIRDTGAQHNAEEAGDHPPPPLTNSTIHSCNHSHSAHSSLISMQLSQPATPARVHKQTAQQLLGDALYISFSLLPIPSTIC